MKTKMPRAHMGPSEALAMAGQRQTVGEERKT